MRNNRVIPRLNGKPVHCSVVDDATSVFGKSHEQAGL